MAQRWDSESDDIVKIRDHQKKMGWGTTSASKRTIPKMQTSNDDVPY
jgi:hypothetical protein